MTQTKKTFDIDAVRAKGFNPPANIVEIMEKLAKAMEMKVEDVTPAGYEPAE